MSQMTTATPPASNETETPKGEKSYFDITPLGARQVVTAPATPTGRTTPRKGIQFSPRLEVHETWHSQEYDRRGEPATCNRLTAQLAQMIKEELNAFKMEEMVVHEVPHPNRVFVADEFRKVELIHTSFEIGLYDLVSCFLVLFLHWNMHG
jgi:hypothetical protein